MIGMLTWKTVIGVVLLIITAIKYLYDYFDVDAQNHYFGFKEMMRSKRNKEGTKD